MFTPTALKAEIDNDPLSLGYAALVASGSDQGIADLLNAKNYTQLAPVSIPSLLIWGAKTGALAAIQNASTTVSPVQSAAIAAITLLRSNQVTDLDIGNPDVAEMLSGFVTANVLTQQQVDSLTALATSPASRGEVLFGKGTTISNSDVSFALRGVN